MRRVVIVGLFLVVTAIFTSAQTQQESPWWIAFEAGDGQLKLTSDQQDSERRATFQFGFAGGHRLGSRARIGVEVDGWLLQASNFNDPTVGENVSNVLGLIDVFPVRKLPLFLRGGAGLAMYTNNRPDGYGGNGFAWVAGAGYEIPVTRTFAIAPIVDYAAGTFSDVRNPLTVQTGRGYSVVEIKAALVWHIGKPK